MNKLGFMAIVALLSSASTTHASENAAKSYGVGYLRNYTPRSTASPEHEKHFQEFYDDLNDDYDVDL